MPVLLVDLITLHALAEDHSKYYINTPKESNWNTKEVVNEEMTIICILISSKYECKFTF